MELSRRVREISRKAEFLEAGTELHEKIEANILAQEIDAMYVHWGLVSIDGLIIDGELCDGGQATGKGPGRRGARDGECDQRTVWVERSRKKKLIVAFHFQLGNHSAWNCGPCRKSGLERKRRCGWQAKMPIRFADRLAAGESIAHDLSDVLHHSGEHRAARGVPCLEASGRGQRLRPACAFGGGYLCVGERAEDGKKRWPEVSGRIYCRQAAQGAHREATYSANWPHLPAAVPAAGREDRSEAA